MSFLYIENYAIVVWFREGIRLSLKMRYKFLNIVSQ